MLCYITYSILLYIMVCCMSFVNLFSWPFHVRSWSLFFCGCVPSQAQTAWTGPAVAPALDAAATPAPACRDMACGPDEPYREPRPGFFEVHIEMTPRDILWQRRCDDWTRTPAMLDVACQTKESFFDRSVRFLSSFYDVRFTEASLRCREDVKHG